MQHKSYIVEQSLREERKLLLFYADLCCMHIGVK